MDPRRHAVTGTSSRARAALLLLAFVALAVYYPLNRRAGSDHVLATALDRALPFIPVFAVPYLLFLIVLPVALLAGLRGRHDITRVAVALIMVFVVSDIVFFVYPTYAPRPARVNGLASGLLRWIYRHDAPLNDFPSEHVASAYIFAQYMSGWRGFVRVAGLVLAALTTVATVLIRQHTLLGATGGLVLGALAWQASGAVVRRLARPARTR